MKKNAFLLSILLTNLAIAAMAFSPKAATETKAAGETSLPIANISLRDNTEDEIRKYYQMLTTFSADELTGTNLLKNLKPILKSGMRYFTYDNIWKVYEITDRDWELSPASADSYNGTTFDATANMYTKYAYGTSTGGSHGNDPYVHTLYRDRSNPDAHIKEWGNHSGDNSTNREHVWCQSRGFKGSGSAAAYGPAGTDIHHLMSGDGKVNTNYHNDLPYGYVDKTKAYKDAKDEFEWLAGNLVGSPVRTSSKDQSDKVFEPRDEDKGDIARACFYMVARYNNYANETGVISNYEPNLALADYTTANPDGIAEYSGDFKPVYMGIMSDLLEWNKLDPVDDYEIHRNNLIYNNFQKNRNPFIDFPQWADAIWGEKAGTFSADPTKDELHKGGEEFHGNTSGATSSNGSGSTTGSDMLSTLFEEHKNVIIVVGAIVGAIVLIAIIVLVIRGQVKVKVTKSGKVKLKAAKPKKTPSKKSTSKKTTSTTKKK